METRGRLGPSNTVNRNFGFQLYILVCRSPAGDITIGYYLSSYCKTSKKTTKLMAGHTSSSALFSSLFSLTPLADITVVTRAVLPPWSPLLSPSSLAPSHNICSTLRSLGAWVENYSQHEHETVHDLSERRNVT